MADSPIATATRLAKIQQRDAEVFTTDNRVLVVTQSEQDRRWLLGGLAEMEEALLKMKNTNGMHGPCHQHSCSECKAAWKLATEVLVKYRLPTKGTTE